MEMPRKDIPIPALLDAPDSYVKFLAESGYKIFDIINNFQKSVEKYSQKTLANIWERTIQSGDNQTDEIQASDILGKYVHWRFSGLFKTIWVDSLHPRDGRWFIDEPHRYDIKNPDGPYGTDHVLITIEKRSNSWFFISAEDENGLGLTFDSHNLKRPIAYSPRLYAVRAEKCNKEWQNESNHTLLYTTQAMLTLTEEAKNLHFTPISNRPKNS